MNSFTFHFKISIENTSNVGQIKPKHHEKKYIIFSFKEFIKTGYKKENRKTLNPYLVQYELYTLYTIHFKLYTRSFSSSTGE